MSGGDATVIIYNFITVKFWGTQNEKNISDGISIKVSEFP